MVRRVSYARKLNASHSVGIMPIIAAQRFEATGLEPFQGFFVHPAKVSNNGHDYSSGYGLRVGLGWARSVSLGSA